MVCEDSWCQGNKAHAFLPLFAGHFLLLKHPSRIQSIWSSHHLQMTSNTCRRTLRGRSAELLLNRRRGALKPCWTLYVKQTRHTSLTTSPFYTRRSHYIFESYIILFSLLWITQVVGGINVEAVEICCQLLKCKIKITLWQEMHQLCFFSGPVLISNFLTALAVADSHFSLIIILNRIQKM